MTPIRLFVAAPLFPGSVVEATAAQAHYLGSVMRRSSGDSVRLFNAHEGEWNSRISMTSRGKATFVADTQIRPQTAEPDLWLVFSPLKRDMTDLVVQKATELGVSVLLPVTTERTNTARLNAERLHSIAVEAAEQSERLTVPRIDPLRPLHQVMEDWSDHRPLFTALERDQLSPPPPVAGPKALLIGPEGGFGPRDRALFERHDFVRPISLGPTILRAETAAIVGLALLQAPGWG